jgi:squalene cyclase
MNARTVCHVARSVKNSPDCDAIDWREVPESPEALALLLETVPVKVAALRMAQLRWIVPGSFRYAAQVATDESDFCST